RRGEKSADLAVLKNRFRLIDDMRHVLFGDLELLVGDQLLHETRIQINKVAGTAADIRQMLDGQAQAPRASRAHHQPGAAFGKMRVGNLVGEFAVIDLVIVPADALLGHAGGAAGFKNIEWLSLELRGHPDLGLEIAEPFVLEMRKLLNIGEALD